MLIASLAMSAGADALVYWGNGGPGTVGRADLDGTHVQPRFITGGSNVRGVAVDADHVYWTNWGQVNPTGTIGRANLDGSGVDQGFIAGSLNPYPLALGGDQLYWGEYSGRVGRVNLDGSGFTPALVTGGGTIDGVAIGSGHLYWSSDTTIGRANVDGTGVQPSFISGVDLAGVAVDGAHIYWGNRADGSIARANLDGSGVQPEFVPGVASPAGVAVSATHLYWSSYTSSQNSYWVGRANLDGTGVEPRFVPGDGQTVGLAVDGLRYPEASAGPDQTARVSSDVTLGGGGSSDANGDPLTYSSTQTAGPSVTLVAGDTATPTIRAPGAPATLGFRLEVCDPVPLCDSAETTVAVVDPAPKIERLEVSPRSFAADGQRTPLASKAPATIRVKLSEAANVRFRVQRSPRRRSGGRAKHPLVFKRQLEQGVNAVGFTGTLGGRTFRPGRYSLIARARDAGGQASKRVRADFRIVR